MLEELNTSLEKGLSTDEITARKEKYGLNSFAKEKKVNPFLAFIKNLIEPLIIVLLAVAALSYGIGQ